MTPYQMVMPGAALRAKNARAILPVIEELREDAGHEMSEAFPGSLKRYALPHLPESTLSKARLAYACCPAFRLALCILALRVGGADRARAQRLVDWLQELVNRLWPEAESDDAKKAVPEHQKADAEEDVARTAYLTGEPGGREMFLNAVRKRHAMEPTLIRALEMEAGR